MAELGTMRVKSGLAEMLKGGVIMDVTTAEHARIAEEAGAVAVMALERVPADIRKEGGVARMADPTKIREIQETVSIPVMAKARIGHFVEAQILEALGGKSPIPLLVGIWPLSSFQLAFRLHNEVPGITIPEEIQQQLADAGADARQVGFDLARKLVDEARELAAGVYVIPPFKEPMAALDLLAP